MMATGEESTHEEGSFATPQWVTTLTKRVVDGDEWQLTKPKGSKS